MSAGGIKAENQEHSGEVQAVAVEEPSTEASSVEESEEEVATSLGIGNSLRSILRLLTSRTVALGQGLRRTSNSSSDSDAEEAAESRWGLRPPPMPCKPEPPDTSVVSQNDITTIVKAALGSHGNPSASLLQCLRERECGKRLTTRDKRRIGGSILPRTGREVARYNNKVFCGVYGRDGDIFLTACQDKRIRIYDTRRGAFNCLQSIQARDVGWAVLDVALSPDGRHLVYSSWSDCLHQVAVLGEDEEEVHQPLPLCPDDRQFCIFSVAFSQDSQELLGGANDGYLYLYDRAARSQTLRINAHSDDVNAVSFVDDNTHILASGGDDGLCKIWDRRSLRESCPRPVGILAGHTDGITFIDTKGDGRYILSNSKDQSMKLWDLRRFSDREGLEEARRAVKSQRWDYRYERLPKTARRVKLVGDTSIMTYTGHCVLQTLVRCRFSPAFSTGQRYVYTGCAAGRAVIYDLLTGEIVKVNQGHYGCVRDVSWHPYMHELITSSWDFHVKKWDAASAPEEEEEEDEEGDRKVGVRKKKCIRDGH